jgi:hypothetical protein
VPRARLIRSLAVLAALTAGVTHAQAQSTAPPEVLPRCFGAAARDPLAPCSNRALRLQVVPAPLAARHESNSPCNSRAREGLVNVCFFGAEPAAATRTVALVGDSHASHWRAALDIVARERGWRGLSMTRTSCPFSAATHRIAEPARSRCVTWVQALPGFFRAHPEIDVVFVVALAGGKVVVPPGRSADEARVNGYRNAWASLPASVRHIVVIRDTPRISHRTVACITRALRDHLPAGVACAPPRAAALTPDPQVTAAGQEQPGRLQVVDLTRVLCSPRLCFPVIGGALVYKDLHHLSLVFARTLGVPLGRQVDRAARAWPAG